MSSEIPEDALEQMDLEAGLEAAFHGEAEEPEAEHSVLAQLAGSGQDLVPVLLRELEAGDAHTPVIRPKTGDTPRGPEGRYQVVGEIARGGVGVVLKGHDVDLGRDVAMKVIRQEHEDNPEVVQRFVEEAQIGGQLQHPGIVPVYEIGLGKNKRPYFTMKLVKGKTLSALLSARKSPVQDRRRFLTIFESVCQTMAYAHARGVIHRDLKPSNVMVGAFGEVLVVDWGMGKVLSGGGVGDEIEARRKADQTIVSTYRSHGEGSQSVVGSVMGTPRYMPPEQARGDIDSVDERSDVFGLGAILCEILTGHPPYSGDAKDVFRMAAAAKLDPVYERLDEIGVDDGLVEILRCCLAPAPTARYQDAGELAGEVGAYLGAIEARAQESRLAAARAEERADAEHKTAEAERARAEAEHDSAEAAREATRQAEQGAAHARRARRLTLALAAVVVLAVAVGAVFWMDRESDRAAAEAETAAEVDRALGRAALLAEKAEADEDLPVWEQALTAAKDAASLLEAGEGGTALRERVDAALAQIEPKAAAAHDVLERMHQARALVADGDVEGALVQYAAAIDRMPQYQQVHLAVARVLKSEDRIDEAIAAYRRALAIRESASALGGLASVLRRHDNQEALELARRRVELAPNSPDAYNGLGNVSTDWADQILAYRAALELDPLYPPSTTNLINNYIRAVERGESRVIEGDLLPPEGRWRVLIAHVLRQEKRFEDAVRVYDLAFEAAPRLEESLTFGSNNRMLAASAALDAARTGALDEPERAALRMKARVWIEPHIDAWTARLGEAQRLEMKGLERGLAQWAHILSDVLRDRSYGLDDSDREAVGEFARHTAALHQRAVLALAESGDAEALAQISDPDTLLEMSAQLIEKRSFEAALAVYGRADELDPGRKTTRKIARAVEVALESVPAEARADWEALLSRLEER